MNYTAELYVCMIEAAMCVSVPRLDPQRASPERPVGGQLRLVQAQPIRLAAQRRVRWSARTVTAPHPAILRVHVSRLRVRVHVQYTRGIGCTGNEIERSVQGLRHPRLHKKYFDAAATVTPVVPHCN